ncbi:MAG TPA: hypothetical protein DEF88_01225, partial [Porphyromonadaceae bacterium]|nr:hypothetical protein [Porphyromonadaceae bacterium]
MAIKHATTPLLEERAGIFLNKHPVISLSRRFCAPGGRFCRAEDIFYDAGGALRPAGLTKCHA